MSRKLGLSLPHQNQLSKSFPFYSKSSLSSVTMRSSKSARSCLATLHPANLNHRASARRHYGTVSGAPSYPSLLNAISSSQSQRSIFQEAIEAKAPRMSWTRGEIEQIYDMPLMELAFAAVSIRCTTKCRYCREGNSN